MKKNSLILLLSCTLISCSYGAVSDTYQEDDILVSFKRAYLKKSYLSSSEVFCIDLNIKILADSKIVRPANWSRYGFSKIQLLDNFENTLGFQSVSPRYQGKKTEIGLRPGEEKIFTLEFGNKPLESTNYLLLKVPEKVFGNVNPFELKISNLVIEPLATKNRFAGLVDKLVAEESGSSFNGSDTLVLQKENAERINVRNIYLGIFIGLSALCSLGLIYFLWRKIAKKTFLYCKSFFLLLPQWTKQNRLHFSILKILSALICLGCLIFGIIMVIDADIESIGDILWSIFSVAFTILLSIAGLWVIYFAIYGIIRLVCCITKDYKHAILWLGIAVFVVWSFVASLNGIYLRTFIPVALAIITITGGFIYTFRNKDSKKDKAD